MEPQAKSISDMKTHMSIKEIYQTLEVEIQTKLNIVHIQVHMNKKYIKHTIIMISKQ